MIDLVEAIILAVVTAIVGLVVWFIETKSQRRYEAQEKRFEEDRVENRRRYEEQMKLMEDQRKDLLEGRSLQGIQVNRLCDTVTFIGDKLTDEGFFNGDLKKLTEELKTARRNYTDFLEGQFIEKK